MAVGKGIVVEGMIGLLNPLHAGRKNMQFKAEVTHMNIAVLVSWTSPETKGYCCQCVTACDWAKISWMLGFLVWEQDT